MAHITQLHKEVTSLQADVRRWQSSAESETDRRIRLESELERAKSVFVVLRKGNHDLRRELQKARMDSNQLKVRTDSWDRELRQLTAVINKMVAVSRTVFPTAEDDFI